MEGSKTKPSTHFFNPNLSNNDWTPLEGRMIIQATQYSSVPAHHIRDWLILNPWKHSLLHCAGIRGVYCSDLRRFTISLFLLLIIKEIFHKDKKTSSSNWAQSVRQIIFLMWFLAYFKYCRGNYNWELWESKLWSFKKFFDIPYLLEQ